MNNLFFTAILYLVGTFCASADFIWVETQDSGKLGMEHTVKVSYGECAYGEMETVTGEAFTRVPPFKVYLVAPDSTITELLSIPKDNHYLSFFISKQNGVYTVVQNKNEINVLDYTQWDFAMFKTHCRANGKIGVKGKDAPTVNRNTNGLVVKQVSGNDHIANVQVLYRNEPLKEQAFKIFMADQWIKTLYTDTDGKASFLLPWKTKYVVEVTFNEEIPGRYNDKDYPSIWHCTT